MARYATPITQYLDDAGDPLSGGKLSFLASGTEVLQNTYSDQALTIARTNPVILDAAGRTGNIWMQDLDYKIRLYDSADVLVWEIDPYTETSTPSGFDIWSATVTYGVNSITEGSDGNFYVSIAANNLNNDPTSTPTYWTRFDVQRVWNTNETYDSGDVVKASTGLMYRSLSNSNLGNDPATDRVNWGFAVVTIFAAARIGSGSTVDAGFNVASSSSSGAGVHDVVLSTAHSDYVNALVVLTVNQSTVAAYDIVGIMTDSTTVHVETDLVGVAFNTDFTLVVYDFG